MPEASEHCVGVVIDVPAMTSDQYDVVATRLGWTREGQNGPDGLLVHAAGPTSSGWRIVDIWRDEQSFRRFSSTFVSAAVQGLGLPAYEPDVFPVHHSIGLWANHDPSGRAVGM